MPLAVEGYQELMRALKHAERDVRLGIRKELRAVAEPVRADEEATAADFLRNMPRTPRWAQMRVGVTQKEVYIVPRAKGARGRGPHRRPNWADQFEVRVKGPVAARNQARVEHEMERFLDRICDRFNRGG